MQNNTTKDAKKRKRPYAALVARITEYNGPGTSQCLIARSCRRPLQSVRTLSQHTRKPREVAGATFAITSGPARAGGEGDLPACLHCLGARDSRGTANSLESSTWPMNIRYTRYGTALAAALRRRGDHRFFQKSSIIVSAG